MLYDAASVVQCLGRSASVEANSNDEIVQTVSQMPTHAVIPKPRNIPTHKAQI